MTKIHLGFKAFDIHELLCHFVAQRSGFYQQQALRVGLIDTTFFSDDQLPPRTFHAACGAALFSYANGAPCRVVLVNTDYPMFWLYSAAGVRNVAELAGMRIASYPSLAPPAHFLAAIAGDTGYRLLPVATDLARLGLLKCGDVDVALISSALPPAVMAKQGFHTPLLLGEQIRAPTSGLAVASALLRKEPELVARMVRAFVHSLAAIHNDDVILRQSLAEDLNLPAWAVEETVVLVRELFTRDGRSSEAVEQGAMAAAAARLGLDKLPAEPLYDYRFLSWDK